MPDPRNPGLAYAEIRNGGNGAHDKMDVQSSKWYLVL